MFPQTLRSSVVLSSSFNGLANTTKPVRSCIMPYQLWCQAGLATQSRDMASTKTILRMPSKQCPPVESPPVRAIDPSAGLPHSTASPIHPKDAPSVGFFELLGKQQYGKALAIARQQLTLETGRTLLYTTQSKLLHASQSFVTSREYVTVRDALVTTGHHLYRATRTAWLWFLIFLDSLEYYYLRYYTLLLLEYSVRGVRLGLKSFVEFIRKCLAK